jgi:hypothetical protein
LRSSLAVALLAAGAAFCFHPSQAAAAPHYGDLVLSDQMGGAAKSTFNADTAKIYLHAQLVDVAKASTLKSEWIAEKTKVAPPNYKMDSAEVNVGALANSVDFNMSKPTKGWPPGDYRVDLFIDGKPAGSVKYQVK